MPSLWTSLESSLFDTHCHPLDFPDPLEWLEGCQRRKIRVHAMSIEPQQYLQLRQFTLQKPNIHASLGLYPLMIEDKKEQLDLFMDLLPDTLFVGEVGLDYSESSPGHKRQIDTLAKIISGCDDLGGRIVSLHSRRAGQDVLNLVKKTQHGSMILHWYSGPLDSLSQLPPHIYFSVNTAMLRSRKGRELLEACPAERVLLESDGPYVESGGKPVFPWELKSVVESLSNRWGKSLGETLEILQHNLARVDASVAKASLRASAKR